MVAHSSTPPRHLGVRRLEGQRPCRCQEVFVTGRQAVAARRSFCPASPGHGVGHFSPRGAEVSQLGPHSVGASQTDRGEHDAAVFYGHIEIRRCPGSRRPPPWAGSSGSWRSVSPASRNPLWIQYGFSGRPLAPAKFMSGVNRYNPFPRRASLVPPRFISLSPINSAAPFSISCRPQTTHSTESTGSSSACGIAPDENARISRAGRDGAPP